MVDRIVTYMGASFPFFSGARTETEAEEMTMTTFGNCYEQNTAYSCILVIELH